jgi:hypothetical protein
LQCYLHACCRPRLIPQQFVAAVKARLAASEEQRAQAQVACPLNLLSFAASIADLLRVFAAYFLHPSLLVQAEVQRLQQQLKADTKAIAGG